MAARTEQWTIEKWREYHDAICGTDFVFDGRKVVPISEIEDIMSLRFSDTQPAEPKAKKTATMAWRVRRQFSAGDKTYPCGSELPDAVAAGLKNFAALKSAHFVEWLPKLNGAASKPQTITPSAPEPKRPAVTIVAGDNALDSWRDTLAAMTRLTGNRAMAIDLLYAHPEGSKLWERAQIEFRQQRAGPNRRISVDPGSI